MKEKIRIVLKKSKFLSTGIKFTLDNTIRKYIRYRRNKIFLNNGRLLLSQVKLIFDELNIQYWLEYGTLLGAIRDKNFIQHDYDIDIGLFLTDHSEDIEIVFKKYGFIKTKQYSIDNKLYGLEESYKYKGIDIDLFYFTLCEDRMRSHVFKNEEGKSWNKTIIDNGGLIVNEMTFPYTGFKKINFLDTEHFVPKEADRHLKSFYGEKYMVKDKSWNPYTMAKNLKVLDDKIGVYINYE